MRFCILAYSKIIMYLSRTSVCPYVQLMNQIWRDFSPTNMSLPTPPGNRDLLRVAGNPHPSTKEKSLTLFHVTFPETRFLYLLENHFKIEIWCEKKAIPKISLRIPERPFTMTSRKLATSIRGNLSREDTLRRPQKIYCGDWKRFGTTWSTLQGILEILQVPSKNTP